MAVLRFSEAPPKVYVIPRLEDELIDELFYQEDEVGEMRHTAFMIECGLEEDPPDGPDVKPIPWFSSDNYSDSSSDDHVTKPKPAAPASPQKEKHVRRLPQRTSSADDIDLVQGEVSPKQNKREPKRRLTAAKSGTLHSMRASKKPPSKAHSSDSIEDTNLGLPLARTEKDSSAINNDSPRRGRGLVAAKSGSLHGMRATARIPRGSKTEDGADKSPKAPARRGMCATKSGTLHGMRKKLGDDKKENEEEAKTSASKRGSSTKSKSGTQLGLRGKKAATLNDKPPRSAKKSETPNSKDASSKRQTEKKKKKKSSKGDKKNDSSDSDSDFFSDVDCASDGSDVSISTDEDSDTEPSFSKRRGSKGNLDIGRLSSYEKIEKVDPVKPVKTARKVSSSKPTRSFSNVQAVIKKKNDEAKSNSLKPPKSPHKKNVRSAVRTLRTGRASPAELLRNLQSPSSKPTKSASVSTLNIPPAFRGSASGKSTRPKGIPKKAMSSTALDIPPAFRSKATK